MINSLCGSIGSIKSENSSESATEPKKTPLSSALEKSSLTPPSLNIPAAVKFQLEGDVEVRSPDSSMCDTFFSEPLDSDFMISSPVRNLPSPQTSSYLFNNATQVQSTSGCSPPQFSSQLGAYSSSSGNHKGKGLSPLHKVFNSPNNQYMQLESLSLPAIEEFLEDGYDQEYQTTKMATSPLFGMPSTTAVSAMLDYVSIPNSSRLSLIISSETSSAATASSQLTQERDILAASAWRC